MKGIMRWTNLKDFGRRLSLAGCMVMMLLLTRVAIAADPPPAASEDRGGMRVIGSRMIWDAAPHNAFTDVIHWRGHWYCSFREGESHSSYDGAARILRSADAIHWQSVAYLVEQEYDLRDPKLCVLPDGRLLVGVGVRKQDEQDPENWHTHSRVYITVDGEQWEDACRVGDPQVWMWRYVTHGEHVYSFGYRQRPKGRGGETYLRFYRSRDGVRWEGVAQTDGGGGYVNEAAFAFEPTGRCLVLLRREGGNSRLGVAHPPYTDWLWTDLDQRFNGPALLRLPDGRLLAGGRSKALGAPSAKTTVGWLTADPAALRPLLWLPSQHETGYPGLCFHDDRVWVSYYSSQSGKCAIYVAQLDIDPELETSAPRRP